MSQHDQKQWQKPEVEEIALENEADVLRACWSASQSKGRPMCGHFACAK
ncbi:MAG: hypothetical protein ABFD94_22355 [Armatimonadia bacterium]